MLYKEREEEWKALKGDKRWEERETLGEIKGRGLIQSISEWLSKMANGVTSQQMETLKPCHYIQAYKHSIVYSIGVITDNLPFAVLDKNSEIDCTKRRDWWKEEERKSGKMRDGGGEQGEGVGKGRVRRRRERGEEWVRGDSKREWKE